jgi:AcrR family transcriptional regulator
MFNMENKNAPPALNRRERKRHETADKLACAAFALFERDAFESVTMEQIATAADVSRGTLYNYFPIKEALLDHYFRLEFQGGVGELLTVVTQQPSLEATLLGLFDAFADWAADRRRYLPLSIAYGINRRLLDGTFSSRDELHGLFVNILAAAVSRGELAVDGDVIQLADYLQHLYLAAILRWLPTDEISPKTQLHLMVKFFVSAANSQENVGIKDLL